MVVSRVFKRYIEGCLLEVLRGFQEYMNEVQCVYQENFKKALIGVLRMFPRSFVLQFCCCLALIAAT